MFLNVQRMGIVMKVKEIVFLPLVMAVLAFVAVKVNADGTNSMASAEATLNTQSYTTATIDEDEGMDTRSYTEDWSDAEKLNTKRIIGTLLLMS